MFALFNRLGVDLFMHSKFAYTLNLNLAKGNWRE